MRFEKQGFGKGQQTELSNCFALKKRSLNAMTKEGEWNLIVDQDLKYIQSVIYLPIDMEAYQCGEEYAKISFGPRISVTRPAYLLHKEKFFFWVGQYKVEPHFHDFRDYTGYTRTILYLPFYGDAELNTNDVMGKYLQIRLTVDPSTGAGRYYIGVNDIMQEFYTYDSWKPNEITADLNTRIIGTFDCQIGIQIPLTDTKTTEIARNVILGAIKSSAYIATVGAAGIPPIRPYLAGASAARAALTSGAPQLTAGTQYANPTINVPPGGFSPGIPGDAVYGQGFAAWTPGETSVPALAPQYNPAPPVTALVPTSSAVAVAHQLPVPYTPNVRDNGLPPLQQLPALYGSFHVADQALNALFSKGATDRTPNPVLFAGSSTFPYITFIRPKCIMPKIHMWGKPVAKTDYLSSCRGFTQVSKIHVSGEAFASATEEEKAMVEQAMFEGTIL